jgi:hypothetical protein
MSMQAIIVPELKLGRFSPLLSVDVIGQNGKIISIYHDTTIFA